LLLDRKRSGLLVVDVQEKLFPLIQDSARIAWNIGRLLDGAHLLAIPFVATEQYPQGLGPTIESLKTRLNTRPSKRMFSCRECAPLLDDWRARGIEQLVVTGIEAHVCVLQTALDCLAAGWDVFAPVDALGSRQEVDAQVALRRLEQAGVTLTTSESVLFEWCESSAIPEFKQISDLVRATGP
jgi:nicotinamidase-related amidase